MTQEETQVHLEWSNNDKANAQRCDCPFVIKLYETFMSEQTLYLLMEVALGGELYNVYSKKGLHGSEKHAKYYLGGFASLLRGSAFAANHEHQA